MEAQPTMSQAERPVMNLVTSKRPDSMFMPMIPDTYVPWVQAGCRGFGSSQARTLVEPFVVLMLMYSCRC